MKTIIGIFFLAATMFATSSHAQEIYKIESIVGIGATLEKLPDGTVQVDALIPNAPAEHSGLAVGDIIVEVKSLPTSAAVDVRRLSLHDIVALIRGQIGVPVEISYMRGQAGPTVLTIVREKFDIDDGQ
jgi:C-terminal processing protease CtpA/Prc